MELNRSDNAAIKRTLKGCVKNKYPHLNGAIPFHYYNGDVDTLYAFCDGHRVLVCDNPGDFPVLDEKTFNIAVLFEDFDVYSYGAIEIDPDHVKASKMHFKEVNWKHHPYMIEICKGTIPLDHDYLLDAMKFTDTYKIYVSSSATYSNRSYGKQCINPVFLDNNRSGSYRRMAMILPVNWEPMKEKKK